MAMNSHGIPVDLSECKRRTRRVPKGREPGFGIHTGDWAASPEDGVRYIAEQVQFMNAVQQYKTDERRPWPTWSEVLEIIRALGYRLVAEPTTMPGKSNRMPPPLGSTSGLAVDS